MDKFKVGVPEWDGEDEAEWTVLDAIDAQDAAQDYVCSGDEEYDVIQGDLVTVIIIDPEGVRTRWLVSGEMVPEYWAEKL